MSRAVSSSRPRPSPAPASSSASTCPPPAAEPAAGSLAAVLPEPPIQYADDDAHRLTEEFIAAYSKTPAETATAE